MINWDNRNETVEQSTAVDNVNHPAHYTSHPSGVETITLTREFSFDLGNAWKYLMRFRYKGKPKEDLDKAIWYVNDYIEHLHHNVDAIELKKSVEDINTIVDNARKVIDSEPCVEIKRLMKSIIEHVLFGANVVCDLVAAKTELEKNVQHIANRALVQDAFDDQFVDALVEANDLLESIDEHAQNETQCIKLTNSIDDRLRPVSRLSVEDKLILSADKADIQDKTEQN